MLNDRPSLKIVTNQEVADKLQDFKRNVVVLPLKSIYQTKNIKVQAVKLYHDVETYGFRITIRVVDDFFNNEFQETKIFYATDTCTLEGISAKDYDFYFLETNYDYDKLMRVSKEKRDRGEYDNAQRVINTHLSVEEAQNFFVNNKKEGSVLVTLHHSSRHL